MKKYLIFICVIWLVSCKIQHFASGDYYKKGADFRYHLAFKPDSTFHLKEEYFEAVATCNGKWKFIAKDTILLMCDRAAFEEKLQSGYMLERNKKVIVLKNGLIKYNKVILSK